MPVALGPRSYRSASSAGDPDGLGPFARAGARRDLGRQVVPRRPGRHRPQPRRPPLPAGLPGRARARRASTPAGACCPPARRPRAWSRRPALRRADRACRPTGTRSSWPLGGGVIGDLAGFVAATYARGLPLLMVPTTLLAQVDSSVGGKVGVNHPRAKNIIGAFHQPVGVWIDTDTLATLPARELRCGLAEVVKYGVILDADFFAELESRAEAILDRDAEALRTIVAHCCRLKADVVTPGRARGDRACGPCSTSATRRPRHRGGRRLRRRLPARRGRGGRHGRRVPAGRAAGLDRARGRPTA